MPEPDERDPAAVTLRPASARVLHAVLVAAALAWAVGIGGRSLLPAGPVVLGLVVLSHAAFWRAAVVVGTSGVTLLNVLRDVEVPWSALEDVTARWSLTLHAGGRDYASWSATARGVATTQRRARAVRRAERTGLPVRAGADGADAESALAVVERHRERWLAGGREPSGGADAVRWNTPVVAVVAACAVAALAAAVF